MRARGEYFYVRKRLLYAILILVVFASTLIFRSQFLTVLTGKAVNVNKAEILKRLKQFPEIEPYTNYPASVTLLTEQDIRELAKKTASHI